MKRNNLTQAARNRTAAWARELRAIKTPALTVRERVSVLRSYIRRDLKRELAFAANVNQHLQSGEGN